MQIIENAAISLPDLVVSLNLPWSMAAVIYASAVANSWQDVGDDSSTGQPLLLPPSWTTLDGAIESLRRSLKS